MSDFSPNTGLLTDKQAEVHHYLDCMERHENNHDSQNHIDHTQNPN